MFEEVVGKEEEGELKVDEYHFECEDGGCEQGCEYC